jgi:hypothetical protein
MKRHRAQLDLQQWQGTWPRLTTLKLQQLRKTPCSRCRPISTVQTDVSTRPLSPMTTPFTPLPNNYHITYTYKISRRHVLVPLCWDRHCGETCFHLCRFVTTTHQTTRRNKSDERNTNAKLTYGANENTCVVN